MKASSPYDGASVRLASPGFFFEHDEWRNENSKSSQELFACGRLAAAVSMDDARGGANAVSISEGVSLTDAIGKADAPLRIGEMLSEIAMGA